MKKNYVTLCRYSQLSLTTIATSLLLVLTVRYNSSSL